MAGPDAIRRTCRLGRFYTIHGKDRQERAHMPAAPYLASPARKFHFISGLPRSGSTLLAAILNQSPRFRAGMTSPLADIMGVVMAEASSKNDFSFDVSDDQRVAMLRGLVENFYAGQADAGDRAASDDRAVSEGIPSG